MLNPPKKLTTCPNCQTSLENLEPFCPNCGQKNQDILLPLRVHLGDVFESIFNWDSRFFRSLKVLFVSPGKITREYNEGKRARYVPPLRMYLIASVLYFLLSSVTTKQELVTVNNSLSDILENPTDTIPLNLGFVSLELTAKEILDIKGYNDGQIDSLLQSKGEEPNFLKRVSVRQSVRVLTGEISGFHSQFTSSMSVAMFFLMPIFAIFLMWFFKKNRKFYVEHLVFSIHFHTLVFLLLAVGTALELTPFSTITDSLIYLGILVYGIFYLKRFYERSWLQTIGRSIVLLIVYLIVLLIVIIAATLITLISY